MSKQKRKGDGYERELAKWLDNYVFGNKGIIHRAPLSGGGRNNFGGGEADLNGTPFIWVEAKRTERFSPYAAMEQAERGIEKSRSRDIPVVISRRNRMDTSESLVVMRLGDWLPMYKALLFELGVECDTSDRMEEMVEVFSNLTLDDVKDLDIIFTPDMDDEQDKPMPVSKRKEKLGLVVHNGGKKEEM